ncbi:4-hydroxy-tetrahydrodipicolinate reductase [Candidatus Ruminimicrobium bovinum]|uniref:4-hydroxy-tetrahydrodipicolinate reductase n=1 Tax=Candidatus Ruminimicrobium bovinum TaxID=3242779 RepID=UPI0039B8FEDB
MINIIVCGACGRMGSAIINMAKQDKVFNIIAGTEIDSSPAIGNKNPSIIKSSDMESVINSGDIIIDFTIASNTMKNIEIALKKNAKLVIGTTGLTDDNKEVLKKASEKISIVFAPNMSTGINLLLNTVESIAKKIPDYDVEIVEIHHNKKKDSPSGTAIRLAEAVAAGHKKSLKDVAIYGRHGAQALRKQGEIGVHAVRLGDVCGDHKVYFASEGEVIEISHKATSRACLVAGALKAAKWLYDKPAGLYDMQNVLDL